MLRATMNDELDFSRLNRLVEVIEKSDSEQAIEALAQIRADHPDAFAGNDATLHDNDLALAEDDLERLCMDHKIAFG
jgi:hypothetical protein